MKLPSMTLGAIPIKRVTKKSPMVPNIVNYCDPLVFLSVFFL